MGFPGGSVVKNSLIKAGNTRDVVLISGLGRSPGTENGNQFQYSCLEIFMDRGAWRAIVPGVTKSWMHLSMPLHAHKYVIVLYFLPSFIFSLFWTIISELFSLRIFSTSPFCLLVHHADVYFTKTIETIRRDPQEPPPYLPHSSVHIPTFSAISDELSSF